MSEEQVEKLLEYIEAKIAYEIEREFRRDATSEYLAETRAKDALKTAFLV